MACRRQHGKQRAPQAAAEPPSHHPHTTMSRSAAAELPAEVLQRIFSSRWPGHARAAPVLDAKEQVSIATS